MKTGYLIANIITGIHLTDDAEETNSSCYMSPEDFLETLPDMREDGLDTIACLIKGSIKDQQTFKRIDAEYGIKF